MGTGVGRGLFEIASLLISVALISMFVKNASGTSQIVATGADAFSGLLRTATGQGQY